MTVSTALAPDVSTSPLAPRAPAALLDRLLRDGHGLSHEIMTGANPAALVGPLAGIATVGAALFGASVGLQGGILQALLSGVKLPIVLLASAALSLPILHVACALSGRPLAPDRLAALVLHAVASATVVMAGLAPLAVVTWLTFTAGGGPDVEWIAYRRLVLAAVGVAALGGAFGASRLLRHLPLTATGIWSVVLALTGLQITWLLRPMVGMPGKLVIVRAAEGTGITEVLVAIAAVLGLT